VAVAVLVGEGVGTIGWPHHAYISNAATSTAPGIPEPSTVLDSPARKRRSPPVAPLNRQLPTGQLSRNTEASELYVTPMTPVLVSAVAPNGLCTATGVSFACNSNRPSRRAISVLSASKCPTSPSMTTSLLSSMINNQCGSRASLKLLLRFRTRSGCAANHRDASRIRPPAPGDSQ